MRPLIAFAAAAAFLFSFDATSNPADAKIYQAAYLGSKALAGTCKRGGGKFHQSTAISHSCTYKNGNVRDCSSKSKTCVVITPDKARVQQATGVGGVPTGIGAVYATITLKCKGGNYNVSTGNKSGTCEVKGKKAECSDDDGNKAVASCETGCGNTNGAGSCTSASAGLGTPPGPPRPRGKPGVAVIPAAGENIREPSPGTQGPTVIYATTTLKCKNGDSHELSTGTDKGSCTVTPGKKAECLDAPGGGGVSATCDTGCVASSGPASCTTKSASLGSPPGSSKPPGPRGKPGVAVIPPAGKSIVDRGGILDSGPGFGSQGPAAATGAPLSTGRGSSPPPGQIK